MAGQRRKNRSPLKATNTVDQKKLLVHPLGGPLFIACCWPAVHALLAEDQLIPYLIAGFGFSLGAIAGLGLGRASL